MAILKLGRFRTGPAGTGDMHASHAAPAAAVENAFPGLIDISSRRPTTRGGIGGWRWD